MISCRTRCFLSSARAANPNGTSHALDQKTHLLRSGQLSSLTGVSTDSLRHYERMKLLPAPRRSSGNYRLYPATAVDRVRLIQGALSIGFTLAELAKILTVRDSGGSPCGQAKRLLEQKLAGMDVQIKELTSLRSHLQGIFKDWEQRLAATTNGEPARLLESLPSSVPRKATLTRRKLSA